MDIDPVSLSGAACPETHPDDVVYEVWPGMTQMCDCLERSSNREIFRDIRCDKVGKKKTHGSPDCFDVPGHPPIVQNRVNGIKVCGRRADGLTLMSVTRPRKLSDSDSYRCPEGTKACNE